MKKDDFPKLNPLVFAQRQFFENGGTKSLQLRRQVLKNLKPYNNTDGLLSRSIAIKAPGMFLSQPTTVTIAS